MLTILTMDEEPFICDECGRQATQAKGTNWCINCENEYQSGFNNPDAAFGYADPDEVSYPR